MFSVPSWIANVVFLLTCFLSIFQHVKMRRPNSVTNLQFFMVAFALLMILVGTFAGRQSPWLSLAFLVIAVACLVLMIRQNRMLPPDEFR